MQRVLVMLTVVVLVTVSLAAGSLAANWPFWQRAWQWRAGGDEPARLVGAVRVLHAGGGALPLAIHMDADLATAAHAAATRALLRATGDGRVAAWFAPGVDADTEVDGRGLVAVLLAPLFAQLAEERPGLLDMPVGAWLPDWRADLRGALTPGQLFRQLSGLPAGGFHPFDPFNARAQLAAGPDFTRAALGWRTQWPPGSHFEESPVNAQLLAMVAAAADGAPFADVLERRLWSRIAGADAYGLLDHRGGMLAAHCCLRARVADWLRLALLLAGDGRLGDATLWMPGFLAQLATASPVHESYGLGFQLLGSAGESVLAATSAGRQLLIAPRTGAALLWIGSGEPPSQLPAVLLTDDAAAGAARGAAPVR